LGRLERELGSFLSTSATLVDPEAIGSSDKGMRPLVEDVEGNFEGSTVQKTHTVKDRKPKSATAQQSINQSTPVRRHLSLLEDVPTRRDMPEEETPAFAQETFVEITPASACEDTPAEKTYASSRGSIARSETVTSSPIDASIAPIPISEQRPLLTGSSISHIKSDIQANISRQTQA
jgi:hypothetical protein